MNTDRASEFLSRLAGIRKTGIGKWLARCPAHEDRTPSLSIRQTEDGRILVHCFGGCGVDDVLAAVGLSVRDLFPPREPPPEGYRPRQGIPEQRARDLIELAAREAMVCGIAARDALQGQAITEADCARVCSAIETIEGIWVEIGHGCRR